MIGEVFDNFQSLQGNVYCGDPEAREYEEMFTTPRLAMGYDWRTRRYYTFKLYGLRTHNDAVTPADPEAQLEPDPWGDEYGYHRSGNPNPHIAQKANHERGERHHARLQERIIVYLMEHGEASADTIMDAVRDITSIRTLRNHLRQRLDTIYVKRKPNSFVTLWGVKGVHDVR